MLIHHYTKDFADAWVVQTDDVNRRLRQWIPSKEVYTVPNTVSRPFLESHRSDKSNSQNTENDAPTFRLLVLSSYYQHKNIEIINSIIGLMRTHEIDGVKDLDLIDEGESLADIAKLLQDHEGDVHVRIFLSKPVQKRRHLKEIAHARQIHDKYPLGIPTRFHNADL